MSCKQNGMYECADTSHKNSEYFDMYLKYILFRFWIGKVPFHPTVESIKACCHPR